MDGNGTALALTEAPTETPTEAPKVPKPKAISAPVRTVDEVANDLKALSKDDGTRLKDELAQVAAVAAAVTKLDAIRAENDARAARRKDLLNEFQRLVRATAKGS